METSGVLGKDQPYPFIQSLIIPKAEKGQDLGQTKISLLNLISVVISKWLSQLLHSFLILHAINLGLTNTD